MFIDIRINQQLLSPLRIGNLEYHVGEVIEVAVEVNVKQGNLLFVYRYKNQPATIVSIEDRKSRISCWRGHRGRSGGQCQTR